MIAVMRETNGKSLSDLLVNIVSLDAATDCVVCGVTLDSRKLHPGELFLACAGYQVHGVYFAEQALQRGAAAILVEQVDAVSEQVEALQKSAQVPVIEIPQLGKYVGVIAERFYGNPSQTLLAVGITGTNGKTSCSQFLAQALSQDKPSGIVGTIGNGLYGKLQEATHTTPDAASLHALFKEFVEQGAGSVVMEVSSHGLHQGRVAGVAFDVAVFTNLSRDHLDYHGDMDNYAAAKKILFHTKSLQHAVINADDAFGKELLATLPDSLNKVAYGQGDDLNQYSTAVHASRLQFTPEGLSFYVDSPWGCAEVHSSLLGRFNVSNLLAVLSTLLVSNVSFPHAIQRIQTLNTVPGRMERVAQQDGGPVVVVDYAHTPDAVEKALKSLREHFTAEGKVRHRIFCVFGCGGDRDKGKRAPMGTVAEANADEIIITNDNPRTENPQVIVDDILQGLTTPQDAMVILDRKQAIRTALQKAVGQDAVIILGKGHEQYQIVGTDKREYEGDCEVAVQLLNEIMAEKS